MGIRNRHVFLCLLQVLLFFCEFSVSRKALLLHSVVVQPQEDPVQGVVVQPQEEPIQDRLVALLNTKRLQAFESDVAFSSESDLVKKTLKTLKDDLYSFFGGDIADDDAVKKIMNDNLMYSLDKMITRFVAKRQEISDAWRAYGDAFPQQGPLKITKFKIMNNDPHHRGGRVVFLYVQDKVVVYKPSSVDANFVMAGSNNEDSFFNHVNEWIKEGDMLVKNNVMRQQLFMTYPVVSAFEEGTHSKYGFLYFLPHYDMRETEEDMGSEGGAPPASLDRRGYISTSYMAGQLFAILSLFRVGDLHVENLMAVETKDKFRCNSRATCYALKNPNGEVPDDVSSRFLVPPSRFVQLVVLDVEMMFTPQRGFNPQDTTTCKMTSGSFCPVGISRKPATFDDQGNFIPDTKHDANAVIRFEGYVGYPPDPGVLQVGFADMFDLLVEKKENVDTWFANSVPDNSVFRIVPIGTATLKTWPGHYYRKVLEKRENQDQNPEASALGELCTKWFTGNQRCKKESGSWKCKQYLAIFGGQHKACATLKEKFLSSLDVPAFYYRWNSKDLLMPQLDHTTSFGHVGDQGGLISGMPAGSNKVVAEATYAEIEQANNDHVLGKTLKQLQKDFVDDFLKVEDEELCESSRKNGPTARIEACTNEYIAGGVERTVRTLDVVWASKKIEAWVGSLLEKKNART